MNDLIKPLGRWRPKIQEEPLSSHFLPTGPARESAHLRDERLLAGDHEPQAKLPKLQHPDQNTTNPAEHVDAVRQPTAKSVHVTHSRGNHPESSASRMPQWIHASPLICASIVWSVNSGRSVVCLDANASAGSPGPGVRGSGCRAREAARS